MVDEAHLQAQRRVQPAHHGPLLRRPAARRPRRERDPRAGQDERDDGLAVHRADRDPPAPTPRAPSGHPGAHDLPPPAAGDVDDVARAEPVEGERVGQVLRPGGSTRWSSCDPRDRTSVRRRCGPSRGWSRGRYVRATSARPSARWRGTSSASSGTSKRTRTSGWAGGTCPATRPPGRRPAPGPRRGRGRRGAARCRRVRDDVGRQGPQRGPRVRREGDPRSRRHGPVREPVHELGPHVAFEGREGLGEARGRRPGGRGRPRQAAVLEHGEELLELAAGHGGTVPRDDPRAHGGGRPGAPHAPVAARTRASVRPASAFARRAPSASTARRWSSSPASSRRRRRRGRRCSLTASVTTALRRAAPPSPTSSARASGVVPEHSAPVSRRFATSGRRAGS